MRSFFVISLPPASQPTMSPSTYKNKTPLIATGIDPNFKTPIQIMSELRQYHPSLRVLQIKQTKNGDTPKDFNILQSEAKMKQVFRGNVKVTLPRSYHSADASKSKILVFKGVSINITVNDFKELLDFNKITHAEAERMKSKRTGRDLPFIKLKCDDPEQAEALISGGCICQKAGIIFKVEEFQITPSIQQCFKCQGFGQKAQNCTKKQKCVVCGEAHSHKSCLNKDQKTPKCANCRGPHIENYRGCPAYKDQAIRQHVVQNQISYASMVKQASPPPPPPPQQHIQFHSWTNCIPGNKCGPTNRSATIVYQKPAWKTSTGKIRSVKTDHGNSQKMSRGQYCRQRCVWVNYFTASSSSTCALCFQLHTGWEKESSSAESFYGLKQGCTTISYAIFSTPPNPLKPLV